MARNSLSIYTCGIRSAGSPSRSCTPSGLRLSTIEQDLKILDLEVATCNPSNCCTPSGRRPCSIEDDLKTRRQGSASPLAKTDQLRYRSNLFVARSVDAHTRAIRQAEEDLAASAHKIAILEARLRNEAQPHLAASSKVVEMLSARTEEMLKASEAVVRRPWNAGAILSSIAKSQRDSWRISPSEPVRRTLTAVCLLLTAERYNGKHGVQVDESRDWSLCQKMLADNSFIARLEAFNPAILDDVPQVPLQIAASYFGILDCEVKDEWPCSGLSNMEGPSHGSLGPIQAKDREIPFLRPERDIPHSRPSTGTVQCLPKQRSSLRASASASLLQKPSCSSHAEMHAQRAQAHLRRSSSALACLSQKPPLDMKEVQRASEPCAVLFQWMRDLVLQKVRQGQAQKELLVVQAELDAGKTTLSMAENLVEEFHATISKMRSVQLIQEQMIERKKQQAVPEQANQAGDGIGDIIGAWERGTAAARPHWKRAMPSAIIVCSSTNLHKGKWRHHREHCKLLPSLSGH